MARDPVKPQPGPSVRSPRHAALTPQEMWEMVLDKRGLETRVPGHAVEVAKDKAKAAQDRLAEEQRQRRDAINARREHPDPEDEEMRTRAREARQDVKAAEKEAKRMQEAAQSRERNRSEPVADVAEPLPTLGAGVNKQQLGHGTRTYGAIQVSDANGEVVAFGIGSFEGDQHAEEHALTQIRGS